MTGMTDEELNKIGEKIAEGFLKKTSEKDNNSAEGGNGKNEFDYDNANLWQKITHNIERFGAGAQKVGNAMSSAIGFINSGIGVLKQIDQRVANTWGQADTAASKYAKSIGMSAQGMARLRKETIDFVNTNLIGMKYNTSMQELIELQSKYNTELGRSIDFTNSQKENMAALKALMGADDAVKFTAAFDKFGLDTDRAADAFEDMFKTSTSKGIVLQKYSETFLNNIDLAQKYTFQEGVRGLQSMVEKSVAVKWNLQQTAALAEKVRTVEGAVKTGAQLSVLGGSFAQFSNPMNLLYGALNNMESLNDDVLNMFSKLGTWDNKKGQVDVSAFNRERIRAAAEAMGMDYGQVMESVNAMARRGIAEKQINGDLDDGLKELFLNKAQIDENGRAYVTIDNNKVYANEINDTHKKKLANLNKSQAEDVKDIAQMLRGYVDAQEGREKQQQSYIANLLEKSGIGGIAKNANDWFASHGHLLTAFLIAQGAASGLSALGKITSVIGSGMRWLGSGFGGMSSGGGFGGTTPSGGGFGGTTPLGGGGTIITGGNRGLSTKGFARGRKMINRLGSKGARFISKLPKRIGAGMALGAVGTVGQFATDALVETGVIDKYGAGHYAGNALSTAAKWAGMGAILGPWGALVGGVLGGIKGLISTGIEEEKFKRDLRANDSLAKKHIHLNGQYETEEKEAIAKGRRAVNKIPGLFSKMVNQGDGETYEALEFKTGGIIPGPSHENGGVAIPQMGIEVEGGEYVINKKATEKYKNTLNAINNDNLEITPIEPNNNQNSVNSNISLSPLNISINGTISLDLKGNKTEISGKELLSSPEFMRELTAKITKEINLIEHKRFNKENYWKKV